MKKCIIPFLFILMAACKSSSDSNLKVKGVVLNNPEKQTIFLDAIELDAIAPRTLDTAVLQAGKTEFSLNGMPSDFEGIYRLRFEKDGCRRRRGLKQQPLNAKSTGAESSGNAAENGRYLRR